MKSEDKEFIPLTYGRLEKKKNLPDRFAVVACGGAGKTKTALKILKRSDVNSALYVCFGADAAKDFARRLGGSYNRKTKVAEYKAYDGFTKKATVCTIDSFVVRELIASEKRPCAVFRI